MKKGISCLFSVVLASVMVIGSAMPSYCKSFVYGDIDNNGTVNVQDAAQLYKKITVDTYKTPIENATNDYFKYCDVNSDGIVNIKDIAYILKNSVNEGYDMPKESKAIESTVAGTAPDGTAPDGEGQVIYQEATDDYLLKDTSTTTSTTWENKFQPITSGRVTISGYATPTKASGSWAFCQIRDEAGSEVCALGTDKNKNKNIALRLGGSTYVSSTMAITANTKYSYEFVFDMDSKTVELTVNGNTLKGGITADNIASVYNLTAVSDNARNLIVSMPEIVRGIADATTETTTVATTQTTTVATTVTTTKAETTTEATTKVVEPTTENTTAGTVVYDLTSSIPSFFTNVNGKAKVDSGYTVFDACNAFTDDGRTPTTRALSFPVSGKSVITITGKTGCGIETTANTQPLNSISYTDNGTTVVAVYELVDDKPQTVYVWGSTKLYLTSIAITGGEYEGTTESTTERVTVAGETTTESTTVEGITGTEAAEPADFVFSGKAYVVGDSTSCDYTGTSFEGLKDGWGSRIDEYLNGVTVSNLGQSGKSSKTLMEQDKYQTLLANLGKGDYLFIQFGHNDNPKLSATDSKETVGSFKYYLYTGYVKLALDRGAQPVLVTPTCKLQFKDGVCRDVHGLYDDCVRDLARELGCPLIDLNQKGRDYYTKIGETAAGQYHYDGTHFNPAGAFLMAEFVADGINELDIKIKNSLKTDMLYQHQ